jgi:hypothetical protein
LSVLKRIFASKTDASLEARVALLEKRWEEVDLEWSEWFGKFRLLYQRISKRAKVVEAAEEAEGVVQPDGNPVGPAIPGLSPSQQRLQQQIISRRSALTRGNSQ